MIRPSRVRDVIPLRPDQRLGEPTNLVRDAHAAGLEVVPFTFAPENRSLTADFRSDDGVIARNPGGLVREITRYLDAGIDGLFCDDPTLARRAVDAYE